MYRSDFACSRKSLLCPRSAYPAGFLGDLLYKIDRALIASSLCPGFGALRAPSALFRAGNFRNSLKVLRGFPSGIIDAHHILPQEFEAFFASKGLNIHEPRFGVWWSRSAHRSNAKDYNRAWNQFILNNPNATVQEITDFGKQLMSQYGFNIFWF
jgi:hypothetical protein